MSSPSSSVLPSGVHDIFHYVLVSSITASLAYGIYLTVFCQASQILYHKLRAPNGIKFPSLITIALFFTGSLYFCAVIATYIRHLHEWKKPPEPVQQAVVLGDDVRLTILLEVPQEVPASINIPNQISYIGSTLSFALGDIIVVWRSYVISASERWKRFALIALLVCNMLVATAAIIMDFTTWLADIGGPETISRIEIVYSSFFFFSFGVNFFAIILIALKARSFQRVLDGARLYTKNVSPVLAIFWVISETGILFCILQLLNAIFNLASRNRPFTPEYFASAIFRNFAVIYAAMYPCLVFIIIDREGSLLEMNVVDHDIVLSSSSRSGAAYSSSDSQPIRGRMPPIRFAADANRQNTLEFDLTRSKPRSLSPVYEGSKTRTVG